MGLETGTYIADLVSTNPISTDLESEGDNHLRLVKAVLQATFPGANREFPIPTSVAKTADYSVLSTDQNKFFAVDTSSGAVTLTMPTLTSAANGWQITVIKTNTGTNPIFIAPPSGNLVSGPLTLTKTRRCVPGVPFRVIWMNSTWVVERTERTPVGTVVPFFGASLPVGYEWPNGQTLSSSANYPDYNSLRGGLTTPDLRERMLCGTVLGGASPSRIGTIIANTLETGGGTETVALSAANHAAHTHTFTTAGASVDHTHTFSGSTGDISNDHTHNYLQATASGVVGSGGQNYLTATVSAATTGVSTGHTHTYSGTTSGMSATHTHTGTTDSQGSGTAHSNMPPTLICNYLLVVE